MKKIIFLVFAFITFMLFSQVAYSEYITLRPNATIKSSRFSLGCTNATQWDCLNEVTTDEAVTEALLTVGGGADNGTYDLNDTKDNISGGIPAGARIDWVMPTIRTRDNGTAGTNNVFTVLNVSSSANGQRSIYNGTSTNIGAAWVNLNGTNSTTNPKTGAAWVLSEVDGLLAGFGSTDTLPQVNVTQVFVLVGFTPVLTANASFGNSGAKATVQANSSTQLGTVSDSDKTFNGTCNVNGGTSNVALYIQDNSSGSFANTSGSPGAFVSTNRTVYNLTAVSGTSGNMFFNISITNNTAQYGFRIQCNGPNAVPSAVNSTVETNLTVLFPVEANASFLDAGATVSTNTNSSTIFNGTCIAKGANSNSRDFNVYVQDNSSGSFVNTSGAVGAFIYTNRTVYNITTTSTTSANMFFNISVTNKTAEYAIRIQCTVSDGAPSWQNSTVETNYSLVLAAADTCTPTAGQDWLLNCADNCQLDNKHYAVKKINATGTGTILFSSSTINYTALNFKNTCRFAFNGTFVFRRG